MNSLVNKKSVKFLLGDEHPSCQKIRTNLIDINPWLIRYLTAGQIKVLGAILLFVNYNHKINYFPSNRTLVFYSGLGSIKPNSKDEEKYILLDEEEQRLYRKRKIKNAIGTIKNIKRQLKELKITSIETINQKSYLIVNLEWEKITI